MNSLSLEKKLKERESKGLLRNLVSKTGLIDFTSNDYLGLARSPELFQLISDTVHQLRLTVNGSGGSRLLSGNSPYAEEVENRLASIFHAESALIFNSGYTANLAVLSALPTRHDSIIYDELAHTSIKDGARLSMAKRISFKHNNLHDLEEKIQKAPGHLFIAVESIYSMDGDACPLKQLTELAERYDCTIILDEAHSTGTYGPQGSGLAVSQGLEKKIGVRIYTFGKAMGVHGACVAGSNILRQYLVNYARPFIYTTALPPHSLAAIDCAFHFLQKNIHLQGILAQKVNKYLTTAVDLSHRTASSASIQTMLVPNNESTQRVAGELQKKGFDVRAILSPTVAPGNERLRICLHTFNGDDEIVNLVDQMRRVYPSELSYKS